MRAQPRRISRSDALHLWHNVVTASIHADGPDLSARQMAIILCVYLDEGPHTVRSLAAHINVTKAVITRALNTMGQDKLIQRCPDPRDKRSVIIARTPQGARYLSQLGDFILSEMPCPQQVELSVPPIRVAKAGTHQHIVESSEARRVIPLSAAK